MSVCIDFERPPVCKYYRVIFFKASLNTLKLTSKHLRAYQKHTFIKVPKQYRERLCKKHTIIISKH